jgi:hypothetical protein
VPPRATSPQPDIACATDRACLAAGNERAPLRQPCRPLEHPQRVQRLEIGGLIQLSRKVDKKLNLVEKSEPDFRPIPI